MLTTLIAMCVAISFSNRLIISPAHTAPVIIGDEGLVQKLPHLLGDLVHSHVRALANVFHRLDSRHIGFHGKLKDVR